MLSNVSKSLPVNRVTEGANTSTQSQSFWHQSFAFLAIILVAYTAYGLFYVPAIFLDDWGTVIEWVMSGNAKWIDLEWRRPLLFTPFLLQYHMFGVNLTGYYVLLWSLYVLMTIFLYKTISRLPLRQTYTFAVISALLFLIYPTNYTHMWLIMLGVYCIIVLTLIYAYLLLRFAQGGYWPALTVALLCLLLTFGVYEGQLGIACTWVLILVVIYRQIPFKRRLGLLLPIGITALFAIWRTLGYKTVGINDRYFSDVATDPSMLLDRLVLGYKITLAWGWTHTIEELLPWRVGSLYATLLLSGVVGMLWFIVRQVTARQTLPESQTKRTAWPFAQRWPVVQPYAFSAIVGVILIGAGYLPFIPIFLPSLATIVTRFNIFATLGGAIFIASVLMIASLLLAKTWQQSQYLFVASAVPFVILGIVTQASVQYHNRIAWHEQKLIWERLFTLAPNFKNDTLVLFVLPGYQERSGYANWRRTPLTAPWEATGAMRALYGNTTLRGDVYFPDLQEPTEPSLTLNGLLTLDIPDVIPYAQTVAFIYDNSTGDFHELRQLPAEWVEGATAPIQLCSDCILPEKVKDTPLRILVQNP